MIVGDTIEEKKIDAIIFNKYFKIKKIHNKPNKNSKNSNKLVSFQVYFQGIIHKGKNNKQIILFHKLA